MKEAEQILLELSEQRDRYHAAGGLGVFAYQVLAVGERFTSDARGTGHAGWFRPLPSLYRL